MPARSVNVSPAASSVSNSDTMSWCQKFAMVNPGRILVPGSLTERPVDDIPEVDGP